MMMLSLSNSSSSSSRPKELDVGRAATAAVILLASIGGCSAFATSRTIDGRSCSSIVPEMASATFLASTPRSGGRFDSTLSATEDDDDDEDGVFVFDDDEDEDADEVVAANDDNEDDFYDDIAGETFDSLGLDEDLVRACEGMGWRVPTPCQRLAVPAVLNMVNKGVDDNDDEAPNSGDKEGAGLWCEAPTGSGKTAAFALPLLQLILNQKRLGLGFSTDKKDEGGFVSALILCPTRELASQTGSVFERLASHLPPKLRSQMRVEVVTGGTMMEPQVARLAAARKSGFGVDVVVATPGRLSDVLNHKDRVDPTASALERRILDAFEAKEVAVMEARMDGKKKKGRGRGGGGGGVADASSLTLQDIQDLDLDRVDDDGRGSLDDMLRRLDYLVLDEADRLLGGAFKEEVNKLLDLMPEREDCGERLKTMLFSATFPEQIETRADRVLTRLSSGKPLRISTSAAMLQHLPVDNDDDDDEHALSRRQQKRNEKNTGTTAVAPDAAPDIQLRAVRLNERDRTKALRKLLDDNDDEWDRTLVFVGTRYAAEHVSRKLNRYDISSAALHGKLDQNARDRRLAAFRAGRTRVLVSTDLASRGIDVEALPAVVNYDLPRAAADFTHRVGRTGRAGRKGTAVSFVTAKTEPHFDFIERRELRGQLVEREVWEGFEPDESTWEVESEAGRTGVPGAVHSERGLAHDKAFGGVKGRKTSKKDKLREAAAREERAKAK